MKKTLALLLAVLTLICSLSFAASAETEYNYKISTEFYAADSNGEWAPVTSVAAGSDVKMRVSISTNFVSGPATLLLAYDKAVLSASGLSSTSSTSMTLNDDFDFISKIQQIAGADGTNAANKQLGLGNITREQFNAYGFIVASIRTNGCIIYDGSDWLFELDMTVLKSGKGKTLECFVIPETVCTVENTQGFVAFPYAESTSSSLTELAAAYLWYENVPELESAQVTVTPSLTERTLTWVVDGMAEKVEYYEIGDTVTGAWIPEKAGYTFAGWLPEVPDTMTEENLTLTAQWDANEYKITFENTGDTVIDPIVQDYGTAIAKPENPVKTGYTFVGWQPEIPNTMPAEDITISAIWQVNSYDAVFDANGGLFANNAEDMIVSVDFDSEITAPETPVMQGYVFAGWAETKGGEAVDSLGKMDSVNGKSFYAVWLVADDVAYTVETYVMGADGEYKLTKTGHTGTTGKTANAQYTVAEGFSLNEEKSVLSGKIAADGSLVLKVYIDRNSYKFTTVVDGRQTTADYLYGADVAAPATPSKAGFTFTGWSSQLPQTMPANDVTVTANFKCVASVKIKNNPGSKTINYGEKLRLTAVTTDLPADAKLYWYVDGVKKGEGTTFDVSLESGSVEVTVKVVDANGNDYSDTEISDSQKVSVNSGFFQKIISFFKNLFGMNRTVIQRLFR